MVDIKVKTERPNIKYKSTSSERALNQLSQRTKDMCQFYVNGKTPREAALLAGYNEGWANKKSYGHIMKPAVRTYIEMLKNEQIERTSISPDFVVKSLVRIADKAEKEGRYNDATRAMELLGKHLQMFKEISRQEVEVTKNNPFSTGSSEVAKRSAAQRLLKVTGHINEAKKKEQQEEDIPDDAQIH